MKMEIFENYSLQLTDLLRCIEEETKHVIAQNPFRQEMGTLINRILLLYFVAQLASYVFHLCILSCCRISSILHDYVCLAS